MEHIKIKCQKEKNYDKVNTILSMSAIEHYQRAPGKPIHLCGFEKKKDVEQLLEKYNMQKKASVKVEAPDFDEAMEEFELS
jgi:hypothetical protein